MPLVIGTRLVPYEIVAPLGQGGMSARGYAEPRTGNSEARHQRQFALGVGPRASNKGKRLRPARGAKSPSASGGVPGARTLRAGVPEWGWGPTSSEK